MNKHLFLLYKMENNFQHNFALHNLPIRDRTEQDPDYNEAAPPDRKRLKHLEENARTHLGERVKHILNNHFELEVSRQHNEILEIDKCISRVQQKLQILRYVANKSFFSPKILQSTMPSASQTTMHPAVKNMLGKRPVKMTDFTNASVEHTGEVSRNSANPESLKIPRYIPPKLPDRIVAAPVRGELHCLKKKLIIGNVSRWIPVSERDDTASHKWMVYVRGPKEEPNVSSFVSRVIFFLHPSYAPHDTIHVESHPFHVTRRGWGEFPLRIQVHFQNPLCKPVNIIHNLKLDRSYTGIQTLGAETIVDVMVYDSKVISSLFGENISHVSMKRDPEERSEPGDEAAVKIGVGGENEALAMMAHNSNVFRNPQYTEEITSSDAAVAQHFQVSGRSYSNETAHEDGKPKGECPLLEFSNDTEIGEQTNKSNWCSNEGKNQVCESKIVIQDHDYFGRENETPKANSSSLQKVSTNVEEFREAFQSLTSTSCITPIPSLPFSSIADSATNPATNSVLVRCFNKNGTTFKLPLALLRNAVILQPYRVAKVGESLLRSPALKATTESPANAIQPVLGKVIASIPRPHTSFKPEPNKLEKISGEARFANERKQYDAVFEKIYSMRWSNVKDCVRALARDLCLVNSKAEDPVYRSVRPYTSPSLENFDSWNIGKRRSAEWTRAKLIRLALEKCSFTSGESIWTTKMIMNWCRMQGYSPMCCWFKISAGQQPLAHSAVLTQETTTLTKTELRSSVLASDDEDETIEVESLKDDVDTPSFSAQFPKASFLFSDLDPDLTTWIADSIEKHGFKLGAELYENFLISFSRLLLSHVWREITEDILRRSLSESWLRTQGAIPDEISWVDTYRAISNRPQFDILTNAGMGVEESARDTNLNT